MAAAFSNNTMTHLNNAVRTLYYRRKLVGKLKLTYEEYLQTFVPREARDVFREAAPWCRMDTHYHRWEIRPPNGEVINATMQLQPSPDRHCPPVVRLPMIQGDAPQELVDKIYHWTERGGDASREFGRVSRVLDLLNQNFSRIAIRYYWPTILAICSEGPQTTKDLVHELQDLRQPVKLKTLPPGLQQACRLTAETIATARLISADIIEEDCNGECIIDIVSGQQYKETFGEFCGLN